MIDLTNHVVAITGGARGLGEAYARHLGGLGAAVLIMDKDAAAAENVASTLGDAGIRAEAFGVDVADPGSVGAGFAQAEQAFGGIDVLINNAGGNFAPAGPMEEITFDLWTQTLAVNLTGTWLCIRAVLPSMRARLKGKIVNVSSSMARQGFPTGMGSYVAAKGGVEALTRALAREVGDFGVTVNAVAPGLIPMGKADQAPERAGAIEQLIRHMVGRQAIPRVGMPDDLCGTIAFLASPASDFITGQVITVDGGCGMP